MFKNTLKKLLIIIFICLITSLTSYSYEALNGKYSYRDSADNSSQSVGITSQDQEVLFIVDFSGSMNADMEGKSRLKHALDAIKEILQTADSTTKIGLRTFGVKEGNYLMRTSRGLAYDEEMLCTASTLVLPVAAYNSTNIIDKLEGTKAWGVTPIKYSLQQAVQYDFSRDYTTKKHIILVTDGAENCNGDPCKYIRDLMKVRDDYKIDVIGITIEKNAYSQLNCIAEAGKGNFYPINTPEEFIVKFKQAFSSKPSTATGLKPSYKPDNQSNAGITYKNFVFQFDY